MKLFTITKTGYRAGSYGCIAEYFTMIYTDGERMNSIRFYGLYGPEERIERAMTEKGYKFNYCPSSYGKCVLADVKGSISEYQALEEVKKI